MQSLSVKIKPRTTRRRRRQGGTRCVRGVPTGELPRTFDQTARMYNLLHSTKLTGETVRQIHRRALEKIAAALSDLDAGGR
jgi:hypothetical protein